jgi:hypothetical protein
MPAAIRDQPFRRFRFRRLCAPDRAGEAEPDVVKKNLVRAAGAGMQLLKQQFLSGEWATQVNGWRYPPPTEGRAGNDFLLRAADQSLAGIVANDPAEAAYLVNMEDGEGSKLSGKKPLRAPFRRGPTPAGRVVLVPDDVRRGHESGAQPRKPVRGR